MNLTELLLKSEIPIRELTSGELEKLKSVLLEIYRDLFALTKKHNLTLMLGGGSALGAVRHRGFIPWDDDLDVMMRRSEYEKLPELLETEYKGKYRVTGPFVSEKTDLPFLKIGKRGTLFRTIYDVPNETPEIAIDVFPLEKIPNSRVLQFFHGAVLNFLQYLAISVKLYKKKDCYFRSVLSSVKEAGKIVRTRLLIGKLFSFLDYSKLYEKYDCIAKKYKDKETKFIAIPTGRLHYFGERHTVETFFPVKLVSFESLEAFIPHDFDRYLRTLYGDYMELPPLGKREKHFIIEIKF